MCQLAACIGKENVIPKLLNALKNQEPYFGAHATGIGYIQNKDIDILKNVGHVEFYKAKNEIESKKSSIGIAHSRVGNWVNGKWDEKTNIKKMAHPFLDCKKELCLIHNGVISNKKQLWDKLKENHTFTSYDKNLNTITDSEVAVHLLEDELSSGKTMEKGIKNIVKKLKGSFLFVILKKDLTDTIWLVNWHQPCFIAIGPDESFFCTSKRGFHNVIDETKYTLFQPPKNSLIKLKRSFLTIEQLDYERSIPNLNLNLCKLGEYIIKELEKEEQINFRDLWYKLFPIKVAESCNLSPNQLKDYKKDGISIVNPYIHTLDRLVAEGKIKEFIIRNNEAGVEDTPRFSYTLISQ